MKGNFEKILSDQFDNHSEIVDDQLVWEGIMEKMQPKRKKRVVAWWKWSALVVVSVLAFVGVFFLLGQENKNYIPITNEITESDIAGLSVESPITGNEISIDNKDENSKNLIVKSTIRQLDIEVDKKRERNELKSSKDFKSTTTTIEEESVKVILRKENSKLSSDRMIFEDAESQLRAITRTSNMIKGNNEADNLFGNIKNIEIKGTESLDIPVVEKVEVEKKERVITVLDLPYFLESKDKLLLGSTLLVIEKEKKQLNEFQLFRSMGLYSSIDFGGAKLNSSTLDSDYMDMISNKLTLMEKVGLGIDLDVFKYKGWTFSSGIGIEQLTDKFSWTGSYIEEREGEYIVSITKLVDGSRLEDVATGIIPWEVTKVINYYDDRLLITVPLRIGYEIKRQDHRFGISTGIDMKYQSDHTSLLIDDMGVPSKYSLDGKWLDPSLRITADYGYFISSSWSVGLGLSFSKLKSEYGRDPSNTNIIYKMIGTKISLRYDVF